MRPTDGTNKSPHDETELFYKSIMEQAPVGYAYHRVLLDVANQPCDYVFLEINAAFEALTGLHREDILQKPVSEVLPGIRESEFNWIERYGTLAINGGSEEFEQYSEPLKRWYRVKVHSPEKYHFITYVTDVTKETDRIMTLQQSITALRQAEEALALQKQRFELAINGTNDGIWDWDLTTNTLFLSKRWKEMLGYEDSELKNEFETFASLIYTDDIKRVNDFVNKYLLGEIAQYALEFRMLHKDGHPRWILAKGEALRDKDGKPYRMAGSHGDITERKQVESELQENKHRLELAMEAGEHGFWDWNLLTNETYFSPRYFTMLGYGDRALPMNFNTFASLIHPDDNEQVMPNIRKSLQVGLPYSEEFRLLCKDGSYRWVNGKGKVYLDDRQTPYRAVGVHIDIHQRKIMEEELITSREQAEAANAAKSQFLANMSHEIRTPMNGILGFLELLQASNLSSEQKDFVQEAKSSSTVLLTLINDILDFSKIEAGKLSMESIPFNLRNTVDDVVSLLTPKALEKGIGLYSMIKADVPEEVVGDPSRLRQILSNLIGNAVKFTDVGEVSVAVDCEETERDFATLQFKVRDTGIGINREAMDNLFQSFHQADTSTTRKYGGTGLGLAISKKLVSLMGGEIGVDSVQGEGSTFYFHVRLKITKRALDRNLEYKMLEGANVLVVDDHASNRKIIRSYLQETGMNVYEAKDAGNAITTILSLAGSAYAVQVAILDCQMPGMSGIDLALALKSIPVAQHIKLLLLTSAAQRGDARKAQENGFSAYLTKPVRRDELINCMAIVMGLKSALEEDAQLVTKHTVREAQQARKPRILLVEDNRVNRKVVQHMLQSHDLTCDMALDGAEAIKAVAGKEYDIIFMDCQMPIMDGYACTEKIREMESGRKRTPIIAMTAHAMQGDKEKCMAAGMDDYLSKPIDFDVLFRMIETYCVEGVMLHGNEHIGP